MKLTILSITLLFALVGANCAAAACVPAGTTGLTTAVILTSNQQLTGTTVNATGCDVGIFVAPKSDKVLISGVTVTGANEHGIFVQDSSRVTIQYSVVTGNGVAGHACPPSGTAPPECIAEDKAVELVGTSDSVVSQNVVSHNHADGGTLCANMTETSCMTAISEQGGKENQHGNERFCSARYRCDGRS
jgi:nitrous oxidase accessory protein NosD